MINPSTISKRSVQRQALCVCAYLDIEFGRDAICRTTCGIGAYVPDATHVVAVEDSRYGTVRYPNVHVGCA